MGILQTIFYNPVYNIFLFLLDLSAGVIWISIIITVILVRIILLPISTKMTNTQTKLGEVKPEIDAIQKKYSNDKKTLGAKTMEVYKKNNVNPFSSILLFIFVQIPFFISMYFVFRSLPELNYDILYYSADIIENINFDFLTINLLEKSIILSIIAASMQYIAFILISKRTKSHQQTTKLAKIMQKQLKYVITGIVGVASYFLGAVIALYWVASNLFTVIHEAILLFKMKK